MSEFTRLYENRGLVDSGFYNGFDYVIYACDTHPCAYVLLKKWDPFINIQDYFNIPVLMHGGCTYYESLDYFLKYHKDYKPILGGVKVIGWDYAHAGDWLSCSSLTADEKKWTLEEIKDEIHSVINSIIRYDDKKRNYYG